MGCRTGRRSALACGAAALLAAHAAQAAPVHRFEVPAAPLNQALLDLAVQANVSIAIGGTEHCARSQPVHGTYTLAQALDQMLDGGGCGYQMVDASAVRIFRLRPAPRPEAAAPARPPAPPRIRPPAPVKAAVGEVVVTATRRTALVARIPDAISVLGGERLDMARDAGLSDLSGQVAGLIVTNLGPGSDKVIMRGLSDGGLTGHAQSTVGIYLDDTRLTYNAPDPDLRLTDIDQIETLQGPQGAIYGAGSIGGVVHVVTRAPDLRQFGGVVSIEGAGTVGGGPSGVVEGVLNAPIIPGRFGLRLAAYDEHDGGYVDDVLLGRQGTNTTDRVGGRLALQFDVSPDWSVDLGFVGQHLHSGDSQYATQHLGGYRRPVRVTEPHGNDFNELHLTVQGQTALGQFKNTLSFVDHSATTRYDASESLPLLAAMPIAPTAYDEADRIQTVIDEATLASVGASPFQWLVGGFVSLGRQGVDTRIATAPPDPQDSATVYSEHRTDSIQEYALYGEASYDLTPQLTLSAGARLGVIDIAAHSHVDDPPNGVESLFTGHRSDLEIAPKVSLSYRIDDSLLAYILVSEGQRAGGFNTAAPVGTMFSAHIGEAEPLRRFEGDNLWNIEAGVKVRALSERLTVRAFAFYAEWHNIQSDQLLPSGLVYTANIGDGRNVGIEADIGYRLGDFDVHLTSLLDEPELTHHTEPFPALLHSGLPGVPRGSVGAQVHYERREGEVRPFFNAAVNYVGRSRLDLAPLLSRRMGDYVISRLTGGVTIAPWRLSVFVDNPLGGRGDTFAFGNPFSLRHARQLTPLPPPTGGIQITRSF